MKDTDFLYLALGLGTVYYVSKILKPGTNALTKGLEIITNPESYQTYTGELLKLPFTPKQSWRLFYQDPSLATGINWLATSLGIAK